jgi:hypothetical protein
VLSLLHPEPDWSLGGHRIDGFSSLGGDDDALSRKPTRGSSGIVHPFPPIFWVNQARGLRWANGLAGTTAGK